MPGTYPFDPYASNPACLITNEIHNVAAANGPNLSFIVPHAAPFFKQNLIVRKVAGNVLLTEGVDYILTHRFNEASHGTGKQVYGSIAILDRNFTGQIKISQYRTLGGTWVLPDNSIVQSLTQSLYSIFSVTWAQITGMPVAFPPIVHDHEADDLTGMADVIAKLEEIRQVMITNYGDETIAINALNAHLINPNAHTKAQVGLSNVENLPVASTPEAIAGIANNRYMTALRVQEKLNAMGFQNGATTTFTLGAGSPVQAPNTIALKSGAFLTVSVPNDPPSAIPAETLPLENGAFVKYVVSQTIPSTPQPGTLWLRPIA